MDTIGRSNLELLVRVQPLQYGLCNSHVPIGLKQSKSGWVHDPDIIIDFYGNCNKLWVG